MAKLPEYTDDTNEQGFVEQLEGMSDEEVSTNFFDLMSGILEQYPEDTK